MIKWEDTYKYLLLLCIYAIFTITAVKFDGYKIDEFTNHVPLMQAMEKDGYFATIFSDKYEAANTPLPYLIAYVPLKVFGIPFSIGLLRVVNALISLCTILVLLNILSLYKIRLSFLIVITVLFYPYFLKPSFSYYMAVYGVLFYLLTIRAILSDWKSKWILAGLSLTGAVLSQQFYLVIIPGVLVFMYWYNNQNKRELLINATLVTLPIILFTLPLFFFWGGLTHSDYSFHKISFDVTKVTSILVIAGGLFIPYVLFNYKDYLSKKSIIYVLMGFVFMEWFAPVFAAMGAFGAITGYTWHAVEILGKIHPLLKTTSGAILFSFCLFSFFDLLKKIDDRLDFIFILSLIFFLGGFLINEVLMERHLLPLAVIVLVLSLRKISSSVLLFLTAIFYLLFGSSYFWYYLYVHDTFKH